MNIDMLCKEASLELDKIFKFWSNLRDNENGGYYGYVDYNLIVQKDFGKGVILNSRIMWFFSNLYLATKNSDALDCAKHAFEFMKKYCVDMEYGGVYWMLDFDGKVSEDMKHTYNQAFAIYGLSSYYDASGDKSALALAYSLFNTIEKNCTDEYGYTEAFDRQWNLIDNDKLSEDGYNADKTMNTLLHIIEAYTELYRVDKNLAVKAKLENALQTAYSKVYNKSTHILGVYFDTEMNSIGNVYSYGHDIEASWLIDLAVDVLEDCKIAEQLKKMNSEIVKKVLETAYNNGVIYNQDIEGSVDKTRIWWIQAEGLVGFLNAYQRENKKEYLENAFKLWERIKTEQIDSRSGEWFYCLDESGTPIEKELAGPWKCPYHNGRMCMEVIKRSRLIH